MTRPHHPLLRARFGCALLACALLPSAALLGCAADELSEPKPPAPDTAALLAAYKTPTLALTADTVAALTSDLTSLLSLTAPLCGWSSVSDLACAEASCATPCAGLDNIFSALTATQQADADPASQSQPLLDPSDPDAALVTRRDPLALQGDGFLRVKRTCGGWGPTPVPDRAANGFIELIVGFTDDGLDRVIWGDFKQCKEMISQKPLYIDGAVSLTFTDPATFASLANGLADLQLIIQLDARDLRVDGRSLQGSFDFSIMPSRGLIEVKLDAGPEHLLLVADGGQIGVRAANGDWICDLSQAQCARVGSADIVGVTLP
jgi:hypothetical protein